MTIDTFVSLSAILTGYDATILKPKNDTQKVAELYFNTFTKEVDANTVALLNSTFTAIASPNEANVKAQIVNDPTLGPIAKNILKMWYLAIWYDLNATKEQDNSYVVSSIAYKNGLVWKTMQAHPMGYSEGNFGYWSNVPTENNPY